MKPSGRSISSLFKRSYAVAQAAKVAPAEAPFKRTGLVGSFEPKVNKLPNGLVVTTIENYSPISRIAVVYNVGPRHETGANLGISHCIRTASNMSTEDSTAFTIARSVLQLGGQMWCTTTREHTMYTLECLRKNLYPAWEYLSDLATKQVFYPWEVKANTERLHLDLALLGQDPHAQLIEALHSAAFRSTLGNSLFMHPNKCGTFSTEQLLDFVGRHFTSGNMGVVGLGVDHDVAMSLANDLQLPETSAPTQEPAKYRGGEVRITSNTGPLVYAAVGSNGSSLGSDDLLPRYILQKVMGRGPSIKYSSNQATSKVSKAVAQGTSSPFAASCINASYSDAGLFGYRVVAQAADMTNVLQSVMKTFSDVKQNGLADEDIARAKVQLKAAIAMELETGGAVLEDMAIMSLLSGNILTATSIMADIDKVTKDQVQAVAKNVFSGKLSMAVVGSDLSNTPYLDDLA